MYLYANGCSMTYGSELHDDPATGVCTRHEYRWRYSWPGQLGGLVDADGTYNDAVPSGSNDRILRTCIDFVARWSRLGLPAGSLLVVIGWSHPARREFYVAGDYRQVVPHHSYDLRGLDRLVARYRAVAASDDEAAQRYATQVAALHGFLLRLGIPFLFFDAISAVTLPAHLRDSCVEEAFTDGHFVHHDSLHHDSLEHDSLDRDSFDHGSAESTMVDFLRHRPHTWNHQHPNEAGHRMWAERVAKEIDLSTSVELDPDRLAAAGLPSLGGTQIGHRHDRKGAERVTRFIRTQRIRARVRGGDGSDPFIYP